MSYCCPVRPSSSSNSGYVAPGSDVETPDLSKEEPPSDRISLSDALLDDPMFGPDETKALRSQERVRVLPEPKEMTPAQWTRHRNTHSPFHNGCKYCVGGRRPNTHHRASKSTRSIPLLCGDYGFLREITSDEVLTFLALYLKPWKNHMALPVHRDL